MNKYRRGIKFLSLILGVVVFGAVVTFVSGRASADCDNFSRFPYGFFRCTGPGDHSGAFIQSNDSDLMPGNSVLTGRSITVQTGFQQHQEPRRNGNQPASNAGSLPATLAWVTIDGDTYNTPIGDAASGMVSASDGGQTSPCPNTFFYDPGVVFGDQAGGSADASPIAWNPSNNTGSAHCQDSGRMAYWDNPSSGRAYNFTINTQQGRTGQICMRLWISVRFDGDTRRFPERHLYPDPSGSAPLPYESDQGAIASHIAKNSGPFCINVVNTPPTGSWTINNCSSAANGTVAGYNVTVNIADPDHPGNFPMYYRLKYNADDVSPTYSTSWPNHNQNINLRVGTAYTLQIRDPDIPEGMAGAWRNSTERTAKQCTVDLPPAMNASGSCETLNVQVGDSNSNGSMHVFGAVYNRIASGRGALAGSFSYDIETDDSGNGGAVIPWLALSGAVPNTNDGWIIDVGVHNELSNGSQGAFTVMHGIWVDGPCYQATCSLDVTENVPGSPANGVRVNEAFNVAANISPVAGSVRSYTFRASDNALIFAYDAPSVSSLPSAMGPYGLGVTRSDPAGPGGFTTYYGGPGNYNFAMSAPNAIGGYSHNFWIDYRDKAGFVLGSGCDLNYETYRHYRLTPHANVTPFNDEDPVRIGYRTWVTADENITNPPDPMSGVPASTSRRLYKQGETANINGAIADTDRFISKDYGSPTFDNPYPIVAGDRYCAELYISHHDGWIGPGDKIAGNVPLTASDCDNTVVNKPYFKAYGSGVSAGGDFEAPFSGGGTLAGWNNNTTGRPNFGASTQLNAVALGSVVGFASARTVYDGRSVNDLTFANRDLANPDGHGTTAPTNSDYSPFMGGYFQDGDRTRQLTDTRPKPGVTVSAGNYSEPGGTIAVGVTREVFVAGDVYIANNIAYNLTGWAKNPDNTTNIPSYKVVAGGNIYIAAGVTQLDGLYQAKGQIYTCASGFSPVPKNSTFSTCNRQLLVHGNFVAKKVNLMRSYGSLRNEKPVVTASYDVTTTTNRSERVYRYACAPEPHTYSTAASVAGCSNEGSLGAVLPTQSNGSSPIYMYRTPGAPVLVGYGFTSPQPGTHAVHRIYNTDTGRYLYSLNPAAENYGYPIEWNQFWIYDGPGMGGVTTTTTVPSTTLPPASPLVCSNAGGKSLQSTRPTCAAEVFEFSPEFYLSKNISVEPDEKGTTIFDAFTSLPPVL